MEETLSKQGIAASLVWSIDELKGIGLLDVLPKNATKQNAIEFLARLRGYLLDEVVFAGDSGNDLAVMASEIPSVLVANAADDVRQQAKQMAAANHCAASLYLANGLNSDMNGNYASGILEGVAHFIPAMRERLKQSGFHYE